MKQLYEFICCILLKVTSVTKH